MIISPLESIIIVFLSLAFLIMSYDFIVGINWKCLFGMHDYSYVGQKHGMVISTDRRGVVGTQRNMYKCHRCNKDKPIEDKDYVE